MDQEGLTNFHSFNSFILSNDSTQETDSSQLHSELTPKLQSLNITNYDDTYSAGFPSTLLTFTPQFKTLLPPLHSGLGLDELYWMHPVRRNAHEFILDTDLNLNEDEARDRIEILKILKNAFEESLNVSQRQTLLSKMEEFPDLVYDFDLCPSNFSGLVINNPSLAIKILFKLSETQDVNHLLQVLVQMELSINTMEVVNGLANNKAPGTLHLSEELLYSYIVNSVRHCEKISDKYMQCRQVRLICVFIQSLLRNGVLDLQNAPPDLFYEIQSFCLEFGKLREATSLFTNLKEIKELDIVAFVPSASSSKDVNNKPDAIKTPLNSSILHEFRDENEL